MKVIKHSGMRDIALTEVIRKCILIALFVCAINLTSCEPQNSTKKNDKSSAATSSADLKSAISNSDDVELDDTKQTKSQPINDEPAEPPPAAEYVKREEGTITFSKDVAPIVFQKCSICHQKDEVAPFALLNYDDYVKRAKQILMVLESGFMPPWPPTPGYVKYKRDRSLSVDEIGIIKQWVKEGFIKGDLSKLPPVPVTKDGWELGKPDLVISMKDPYTLEAGGKDEFRKFVVDIPIKENKYIKAFEFNPGNRKVVHHALMSLDRSGWSKHLDRVDPKVGFNAMEAGEEFTPEGFDRGWTVGYAAKESKKGFAWELPAGADFIIELHLLKTGKEETVQSKCGFYFTDDKPELLSTSVKLTSKLIDIPANAKNHLVENSFTMPVDGSIVNIYPHAHYLGKSMKVYAVLPDGTSKWVLNIKKWDVNWQDIYYLKEPIDVPKGTVLKMKYLFDNSSDNIFNPNDPPIRVRYGKYAEDEMADAVMQIKTNTQEDRRILRAANIRADHFQKIARCISDLKFNPDDHEAHFLLGYLYSKSNKLDLAIKHYLKCIELKDDYLRVRNNLASIYSKQRNYTEAKKYYLSAIKLDPEDVKAYNNLGILMVNMKDNNAAAVYFRKTIMLNPDFAEGHCNFAHILVRQKKYKEAIAQYQKAISLKPDYIAAKQHLERTKQILKLQKQSIQ